MFKAPESNTEPVKVALLAVATDEQLMGLAKLFDGTVDGVPYGEPCDIAAHPAYAGYAGTDALKQLIGKNILADFGAAGVGRGWKWDGLVNGQFSAAELAPKNAA